MRPKSSVTRMRSKMMGAASRESSHVLCMIMVLVPPMKISETYSSAVVRERVSGRVSSSSKVIAVVVGALVVMQERVSGR